MSTVEVVLNQVIADLEYSWVSLPSLLALGSEQYADQSPELFLVNVLENMWNLVVECSALSSIQMHDSP